MGKKILYLGLDPSRYHHDGELVHIPVIKTIARPFKDDVETAFKKLSDYTHIILTSRTAASIYYAYSLRAGFSDAEIVKKKYLTIGKATSSRLSDLGITSHFIAKNETAEGIVSLLASMPLLSAHLFFPRSSLGRDVICQYLYQCNLQATCLELYDTVANEVNIPEIHQFEKIVFTSPSTVYAFFKITHTLPDFEKCVAIGPITQQALLKLRKSSSQINPTLLF